MKIAVYITSIINNTVTCSAMSISERCCTAYLVLREIPLLKVLGLSSIDDIGIFTQLWLHLQIILNFITKKKSKSLKNINKHVCI